MSGSNKLLFIICEIFFFCVQKEQKKFDEVFSACQMIWQVSLLSARENWRLGRSTRLQFPVTDVYEKPSLRSRVGELFAVSIRAKVELLHK